MAESHAQVAAAIRDRLRDTEFKVDAPIAVEPIVLPRGVYYTMGTAGADLLRLAMQTLQGLGADTIEMAAALNVDGTQHPTMLRCANTAYLEWAAAQARPDMIVPESGVPQLLELNPSGAAGGFTESELLAEIWRECDWPVPPEEEGVFAARKRMLEAARQAAGLNRRLLWLGSKLDLKNPQSDRFFGLELDKLARDGWQVSHYDPADANEATGPDSPRLVFRHYTDTEWRSFGFDLDQSVRRLVRPGDIMVPDPASDLLDNKMLLALLSHGQAWMSETDRRLVNRHLPWVRALGRPDHPLRSDHPGAFLDIAEAVQRREELVLKPALGMQGNGVLIGRNTPPDAWAAAVLRRSQTDYGGVVQKLVEPARISLRLCFGTNIRKLKLAPVLSPLLADGQMCAAWARFNYAASAIEDGAVTVVNTHRQATEALAIPAEH